MAEAKKPVAKAEAGLKQESIIPSDELNALKAELEALKAEKAKLTGEITGGTMDELLERDRALQEAKAMEKVPIYLIKDNNEYKTDVTVQINGKIWQIQRGVQLMVPKMVADVLKQSQHQDMLALDAIQKSANIYLGER